MNIDAEADAADLAASIEQLGGQVSWPEGKVPTNSAKLLVDVDDEDAYEALPPEYHFDDDIAWSQPEPDDLRDFIGACVTGDRTIAVALLSRLNLDARGESLGQQALLTVGRRS